MRVRPTQVGRQVREPLPCAAAPPPLARSTLSLGWLPNERRVDHRLLVQQRQHATQVVRHQPRLGVRASGQGLHRRAPHVPAEGGQTRAGGRPAGLGGCPVDGDGAAGRVACLRLGGGGVCCRNRAQCSERSCGSAACLRLETSPPGGVPSRSPPWQPTCRRRPCAPGSLAWPRQVGCRWGAAGPPGSAAPPPLPPCASPLRKEESRERVGGWVGGWWWWWWWRRHEGRGTR